MKPDKEHIPSIADTANLEALLNDNSFVAWLKEEAPEKQAKGWNNWLEDDPQRHIMVKSAKKILSMPFVENTSPDMEKELQRMRNIINSLKEEKS